MIETKINIKNIICPDCGHRLEVCQRKIDNSFIQGLCRNCLVYWDFKRIKCTEEDIRELASEG